jgi:beta-lactamase class A
LGLPRDPVFLKSDIGSGTVTAVGGTGGGFGRVYGGGRSWKRDPVNNLSHGASAMKVAKLYCLLLNDRLVAPDLKAEFMEILSDPGIGHKFVAGLAENNPDAEV